MQQTHRRLLEKWLYEGLSEEEKARLPSALLDRVGAHFRQLAETALREVADGRVTDGPSAMRRLRERIEEQRRASADCRSGPDR